MKGTCTRWPSEYWHPPECQFYTNAGYNAGDRRLCPHHKVDEQPNKKQKKERPFPQRKRKRRQECCGYCENCTTIALRLARLGSISFSKRQTSPEKPDAKSLRTDSKNTIHSVYATSSEYPGKERTIVRKNNVKVPHQRSPYAMKFEDTSHEETERQQRCARSKAWNLAENLYKLKQKDKTTFYSPAEEWALLAASTKEPEERKFVVDSGASVHMVSKLKMISGLSQKISFVAITWNPESNCTCREKNHFLFR